MAARSRSSPVRAPATQMTPACSPKGRGPLTPARPGAQAAPRGPREGGGPAPPGELGRPGRDGCGGEVQEGEEGGRAARRVLDERAGEAGLGEGVVVEPVAEHPFVRGAAAALLG